MKKTVLFMVVLLLSGCSDNDTKAEAMKYVMQNCNKPVSVTMTLNQWGNEVKIHCPEIKYKE